MPVSTDQANEKANQDKYFAVTIGAAHAGSRIDRVLSELATDLTRSRAKQLIEAGSVSRNGAVLRQPAALVREGDHLAWCRPPPVPAIPEAAPIPLTILYEDSDLLVLDKPAGLVVHPAPGNESGTLVNALIAHCGDSLAGIGGERRPGIVHRLDRDTSGVMVVAKTEPALARLSADFAARRDLERAYLALVWGMPAPSAGRIEAPIGRDPRDRKRMAVVARGKPAITDYETGQTLHAALALLRCRLQTGRTHQIRVHLASRGHPVVGDPVYLRRIPALAKTLPPALRAACLDFPRQALHAATLGFRHPRTGVSLRFESELPADFATLLAQLGTTSSS